MTDVELLQLDNHITLLYVFRDKERKRKARTSAQVINRNVILMRLKTEIVKEERTRERWLGKLGA